jgi:hypothetical protein
MPFQPQGGYPNEGIHKVNGVLVGDGYFGAPLREGVDGQPSNGEENPEGPIDRSDNTTYSGTNVVTVNG